MEDVAAGEKIFVLKRSPPLRPEEVLPIYAALNETGRTWLLWMVPPTRRTRLAPLKSCCRGCCAATSTASRPRKTPTSCRCRCGPRCVRQRGGRSAARWGDAPFAIDATWHPRIDAGSPDSERRADPAISPGDALESRRVPAPRWIEAARRTPLTSTEALMTDLKTPAVAQ